MLRPPLKPPYSGPHQVVKRIDDQRFIILINGKEATISVKRLKPAFIENQDPVEKPATPQRNCNKQQNEAKLLKHIRKKYCNF